MKIKSIKFYRLVFLVVILTITFTVLVGSANAQLDLDTTFNAGVNDGTAEGYTTAVQSDAKILVGGRFSFANGTQQSNLVRLNADGTLDTSFNSGGIGINGDVLEIIVLSDGKILVGGSFNSYNGITKNGILQLNADGSLDNTFNSGGTGLNSNVRVSTIAVQSDGKYVITGQNITSYNGTTRFSVVRLNTDGTLDSSFVTPFTSAQFIEEVDVQSDGKVLIGGLFTLGNPALSDVIRLNADGSFDTSFNSGGVGTNGLGVFAMTLQPDGKILIGGGFTAYNGTPRSGIARLNTNGSLDTSFSPAANLTSVGGTEYIVVQPDGKILVAGRFMPSTGLSTNLLRLNGDGSLDPTFTIQPSGNFGYHIRLQPDGKIILVSFFTTSSQTRNPIRRLEANGAIDNSFNALLTSYGFVSSIVQQSDGKILVGGNFATANGTARINVARFNLNGTLDATFNPGIGNDNTINTVAIQPDGKVLVGGSFTFFNGASRQSVARLNSDGSLDASFNPNQLTGTAIAITNDIIALPDGKILIGGRYSPGGIFQRLLRLNSNGTIDATFTPGVANGNVVDLNRQPDGKILVGGTFTSTFNGQSRAGIARVNADGTLDTTFNPGTGANGFVQKMALQTDGKVLLVGSFTTFNGTSRNRVARLNVNGSLDTSFNVGTGADNLTQGVLVQTDGKIIIGGNFSTYNGVSRNRLARLNTDGSLDTSVVSGFTNDPRFFLYEVVAQADGKILGGGVFNSYNGVSRNSFLRLTTSTTRPTLFDFDGDGRSDISVFRLSDGVWYLLNSQSGFTSTQFGIATDKLAPADYDGDGRTDLAVYRNGVWYLLRSTLGFTAFQFGIAEDIPQPADFDGDGRAELTIYRPSNGTWYVFNLVTNQFSATQFGVSTDKPVIGDYDGDNRADYAVYRPSDGVWHLLRSSAGYTSMQFGITTDRPVVGDYDADGRADLAVYRPADGVWYLLRSTAGYTSMQFGISTDLPTPADYDGDGRTDLAVYRDGVWYLLRSTQGFTGVQFGIANDKPIPNAFVPQ